MNGDREKIRLAFFAVAVLLGLIGCGAWLVIHDHPQPVATGPAPAPATGATAPFNPAKKLFPAPNLADADTAALIAKLNDQALPLKARRDAAMALARVGSDDALTALKAALAGAPPYLKAAIAEGLGESKHPEARGLLLELLNGADEITARGAVRGLALAGDPAAIETLGTVLFDAEKPLSVRTEVALALGDVASPAAQDLLTRALAEIPDPTVVEHVLDGLGKRPFAETEEFFRGYLQSPDVPAAAKAAALEALGGASGNVGPFLANYLNDADPNVRAAAAWGLASAENPGGAAPQLVEALRTEGDPQVRLRLYQALDKQRDADAGALLSSVRSEPDPGARLAGMETLAGRVASSPEVADYFNHTAVPELQQSALGANDAHNRLASVLALSRARTPEALAALQQVAGQSTDPKVVAAANAALRRR